jgi:hypothetical protein
MQMLILVLLLFALAGSGWGYSRYGAVGASPVGIVLLVLLILYFTGSLGGRV